MTKFLEITYGFAKIADPYAFQRSVEYQINNRFPGKWRVYLAKFKSEPGLQYSIYGVHFVHDGYHLWVMQSE
jgi:hypothetical protein